MSFWSITSFRYGGGRLNQVKLFYYVGQGNADGYTHPVRFWYLSHAWLELEVFQASFPHTQFPLLFSFTFFGGGRFCRKVG